MKSKEKTKKSSLSIEELRSELKSLRQKRFKLRFKHRVTPLGNPMELRVLRRDIARVETWIRAKELEGSEER